MAINYVDNQVRFNEPHSGGKLNRKGKQTQGCWVARSLVVVVTCLPLPVVIGGLAILAWPKAASRKAKVVRSLAGLMGQSSARLKIDGFSRLAKALRRPTFRKPT